MYGRRASQLLKEIDSSEAGQLAPFNTEIKGSRLAASIVYYFAIIIIFQNVQSDVFDQVIRECNEHNSQFQSLIRKMVDQNLDIETTRNEDHYGAAIHHLSLLRNKRCLIAYMYNRAEVIQSFRWKVGPVLPHDIQEKLHFSEKEYFKNHSTAIKSYISEMDIDLTVDMVPPKDPYIQVRVLEDIGEVSLGDHSVSLTKNSLHFLRRTDAEQFISQGLMEEFLE
ncbi:DNA replication complex GINS protein PSF1 [Dichanthelium oligosanthes]|uniref:DNA replication complex GINS protein PSF1 n=1 Tax=Dichanthelium oligosanthes TaxID=888268 RepID=A0A1E5V930_9POAL|nr:DNA replication complex GINS protein PSF1 [Dichanthelium oligosanthes]